MPWLLDVAINLWLRAFTRWGQPIIRRILGFLVELRQQRLRSLYADAGTVGHSRGIGGAMALRQRAVPVEGSPVRHPVVPPDVRRAVQVIAVVYIVAPQVVGNGEKNVEAVVGEDVVSQGHARTTVINGQSINSIRATHDSTIRNLYVVGPYPTALTGSGTLYQATLHLEIPGLDEMAEKPRSYSSIVRVALKPALIDAMPPATHAYKVVRAPLDAAVGNDTIPRVGLQDDIRILESAVVGGDPPDCVRRLVWCTQVNARAEVDVLDSGVKHPDVLGVALDR